MQQGPASAAPAGPAGPAIPQGPAAVGAALQGHINRQEANPLFQYTAPQSVKPSFYDNLLRFGLATMAAGGKPMATTLGAIGEGGLSTYDANKTAQQADITNSLNARKTAITAQGQINQAYERLDQLRLREQQGVLTLAERQEQHALMAQIAAMSNATRQDAVDVQRGSVAQASADRQQRMAETERKDAAAQAQNGAVADDERVAWI
jgi:hypothetical protein